VRAWERFLADLLLAAYKRRLRAAPYGAHRRTCATIEAPANAPALQSTFYRLDLWMDAFEARQPVYLPVVLREAWLGISLTGLLGFVVGNRIRRS